MCVSCLYVCCDFFFLLVYASWVHAASFICFVVRSYLLSGCDSDFDRHFGRCVIMIGIPYQYALSRVLRARLEYLKQTFGIDEKEFMTFDAMRQCAQCVGRVIRSKLDYGMMVFADTRFAYADKRKKLPRWIQTHIGAEAMSLSVDSAVTAAKQFMKQMAQPHDRSDDIGVSLLTAAQAERMLSADSLSAATSTSGAHVQ